MNPLKIYFAKSEVLKNQISRITRKLLWLSVLRLVVFVFIITTIIVFYNVSLSLTIVLGLFFIITFGLLFRYYNQQVWLKDFLKLKLDFCLAEIDMLEKDFYYVGDGGKEFLDMYHQFTYDLDVFGETSLFSFLNRTVTFSGKNLLASWISEPDTEIVVLQKRQEAARELSARIDFRMNFYATGRMYEEEKNDSIKIEDWLKEKDFLQKYHFWFMYLVPVLFLIFLGTAILGISGWSMLWIPFILSIFVNMFNVRNMNKVHAIFSGRFKIMKKYSKLIDCIEQDEYTAELLMKQKRLLVDKREYSASKEIKQLTRLLDAFDYRLNIFAGFILNSLLMWDFQCVFALRRWKRKNRQRFSKWINALAEFDALLSPANVIFNFPGNAFPDFIKNEGCLDGHDFVHPLLPADSRVPNSIQVKKKGFFTLITGANMAGKSTFLRSVGVNMLLGYCGSSVFAEKFNFSPSVLFTSMRTADSLYKNESYFYAELKRLKDLIDILESGKHAFILLDEILKGTNSIDKQKGSAEVLKRLISLDGTGIIATHDLALAELEREMPENIDNKCFEVRLDKGKMYFDYKLRDGIAQNMNAGLLLKQLGIVKS
ncbi:MAG: MutS-related protein [Bacteroidota bacterium]